MATMMKKKAAKSNMMLYLIGGGCHKRRVARLHYRGAVNVLEVGCSVGNVAQCFINESAIRYVGVDIDEAAIRHAQRTHAHALIANAHAAITEDAARLVVEHHRRPLLFSHV